MRDLEENSYPGTRFSWNLKPVSSFYPPIIPDMFSTSVLIVFFFVCLIDLIYKFVHTFPLIFFFSIYTSLAGFCLLPFLDIVIVLTLDCTIWILMLYDTLGRSMYYGFTSNVLSKNQYFLYWFCLLIRFSGPVVIFIK